MRIFPREPRNTIHWAKGHLIEPADASKIEDGSASFTQVHGLLQAAVANCLRMQDNRKWYQLRMRAYDYVRIKRLLKLMGALHMIRYK